MYIMLQNRNITLHPSLSTAYHLFMTLIILLIHFIIPTVYCSKSSVKDLWTRACVAAAGFNEGQG